MRSMEAYPRAAMERAMKVQDVMLQAMAKRITWWQAAEILRHSRPAHAALAGALRGRGIQRIAGPAAGQAVAAPGGGGDGGESVRLVPGEVFRYGAGFIIEAADQARIGRSNHLNCNKPANLRIVGFIDYAHSTLPNGPENVVLSDFYHRTGCGASRSTVSVWAKRVYS